MTPIIRKSLLAGLAILATLAILLAGYAAYDYAGSACQAQMRKTGLDRETAEILDTVIAILNGLQRGTYGIERWHNDEFQKAIEKALEVAKDGRAGLKARDAFAALNSLSDVQPHLAKAKSLATNRVNDIMRLQDPGNPTEYEKLRLEGRNLLPTVKQIDAAFEALDRRTKRLPEACNWSL